MKFTKDTVATQLVDLKWSWGNCTTVEESEAIEANISALKQFIRDNQEWNGHAWVWKVGAP